jgi:hypothetical protein
MDKNSTTAGKCTARWVTDELLGPKNNIRAKTGVEAGVIQIDAENGDQVLGEAVLRIADGVASTTLLCFRIFKTQVGHSFISVAPFPP